MYDTVRSDDEINAVLNKAADGIDGGSAYPRMMYEEGVQAAIDWITGANDDHPFD